MFLDAAIVLVAALFAYAGYRRGLILEIGSILGFLAGIALAASLWFQVALAIHPYVTNDTAAAVIAFVGVFVLTYAVFVLLSGFVRRIAHWLLLGWLDGLGGALLGLVKAAFVIELGLILLSHVPATQTSRLVAGATLAPWLQMQKPVVAAVLAPFTARLPIIGGLLG